MVRHTQEHLWNPDDNVPKGSCYPTVLACLLDLELHDVPYFHLLYFRTEFEKDNIRRFFQNKYFKGLTLEEYEQIEDKDDQKIEYYTDSVFNALHWLWDNVREYWLASMGYREKDIPREEIDQWIKDHPDTPYMVTGRSPRDKNITHIVIHMNGKLYHDPHPSQGDVLEDEEVKLVYNFLEKF